MQSVRTLLALLLIVLLHFIGGYQVNEFNKTKRTTFVKQLLFIHICQQTNAVECVAVNLPNFAGDNDSIAKTFRRYVRDFLNGRTRYMTLDQIAAVAHDSA